MSLVGIAKKICPGPVRRMIGKILAPMTVAKWAKDAALAYEITGGKVRGGPFEGISYINTSGGSCLGAKLLGTYERELNPAIEQIIAAKPSAIIDIGSAEGYYAVGLCTKILDVKMHAFEMEKASHAKLNALAMLNQVEHQITQHGICDSDALNRQLTDHPGAAVICDIEGAEEFVLDPEKSPGLKQCAMLIEVHELLVPGVDDLLIKRFEDTHEIQIIKEEPRTLQEAQAIKTKINCDITPQTMLRLLDELRKDQMQWFWMVPK